MNAEINLRGPYFDFLVAEKDSYWDRRGKIQRIVGIKQEFFHHPDALVIPDSIIELFITCFTEAYPEQFNYHGITIYEGDNLNALYECLESWLNAFIKMDERAFADLINGKLLEDDVKRKVKLLKPWFELKRMIIDSVEGVLHCIEEAREPQQVLLVFGV